MGRKRREKKLKERENRAEAQSKALVNKLKGRYEVAEISESLLEKVVARIDALAEGVATSAKGEWSALEGQRVLDLCCPGKEGVNLDDEPSEIDIWFCRALHEIGACPVSIHTCDLEQEEFENHQLDLSTPEVLNFFPPGSFDAVSYWNPDSDSGAVSAADEKFFQRLERTASRCLKDNGVFLKNLEVSRKVPSFG